MHPHIFLCQSIVWNMPFFHSWLSVNSLYRCNTTPLGCSHPSLGHKYLIDTVRIKTQISELGWKYQVQFHIPSLLLCKDNLTECFRGRNETEQGQSSRKEGTLKEVSKEIWKKSQDDQRHLKNCYHVRGMNPDEGAFNHILAWSRYVFPMGPWNNTVRKLNLYNIG